MAKCDLSIELDEPEETRSGGGSISGIVRVHVDSDVNCKALEVQSGWRTHGRGNVTAATAANMILFEGQWRAGENYEYRFELSIAEWPPSYHGHYLNVDHFVDARARIPWGFDPKASSPFWMQPSRDADAASQSKRSAGEAKGPVGCLVGMAMSTVLVFGFGAVLAELGVFAILFLILPLAGIGYWLVRFALPNFLLGSVHHEFASESVSPGQQASGELKIRPRKNVSVDGITLSFQAREQCVSGSGSNRTTHKHIFFDDLEKLSGPGSFVAGQEYRFPFMVHLPEDAPYSMNLDDNVLIWSATLRVAIRGWPDWVKELPIRVVPSGAKVEPGNAGPTSQGYRNSTHDDSPGAEITFGETATHLWAARGQRRHLNTIVEAVTGLTFDLEVQVERRLLYRGDDDSHVYKDGYAVWAHYQDPELPMVLYAPHELADEFEQPSRDLWRGQGTIIGWDHDHDRLQVKLLPPL